MEHSAYPVVDVYTGKETSGADSQVARCASPSLDLFVCFPDKESPSHIFKGKGGLKGQATAWAESQLSLPSCWGHSTSLGTRQHPRKGHMPEDRGNKLVHNFPEEGAAESWHSGHLRLLALKGLFLSLSLSWHLSRFFEAETLLACPTSSASCVHMGCCLCHSLFLAR